MLGEERCGVHEQRAHACCAEGVSGMEGTPRAVYAFHKSSIAMKPTRSRRNVAINIFGVLMTLRMTTRGHPCRAQHFRTESSITGRLQVDSLRAVLLPCSSHTTRVRCRWPIGAFRKHPHLNYPHGYGFYPRRLAIEVAAFLGVQKRVSNAQQL